MLCFVVNVLRLQQRLWCSERTADLKTWLTKVNYICSAIPSLAQYIPASFLALLLRGEVVSVSSASTVDKLFASLGDFVVVEAIK